MSSYIASYNKVYIFCFCALSICVLAIVYGASVLFQLLADGDGLYFQIVFVFLAAVIFTMILFVLVKLFTTDCGLRVCDDGIVSNVSGWKKMRFEWNDIAKVEIVLVENGVPAVRIVTKGTLSVSDKPASPEKPFFRLRGDVIWCHMLSDSAATVCKNINDQLQERQNN